MLLRMIPSNHAVRLAVLATTVVCLCRGFSVSNTPSAPTRRRHDPLESSSKHHQDDSTPTATATATLSDHQHHPTGFYVHIPYCRRRCRYCNFAIVPIGLDSSSSVSSDKEELQSSSFSTIHEHYQADLFTELDLLFLSSNSTTTTTNNTKLVSLSSIYFGGGTPSLAPVDMIQGILQRILQTNEHPTSSLKFVLEPNAEITMEMDPGTFDLEQLQALKKLGINRISLGVQSFDDTILEGLGRVHRRADIYHAIDLLHQVFGDSPNFSMDLISGVPGLTCAHWIETLEIATSLKPSHLSIYDLQVEEGTVFSTWYNNNSNNNKEKEETTNGSSLSYSSGSKIAKIPALPTEESVAFMYKFGAGYLKQKGYEHYEVSSYAQTTTTTTTTATKANTTTSRTTTRSQHNQIYWAPSSSWYAVGLGATSCVEGRLQARPKTLADYHTWVVEQQQQEEQGKEISKEEITTEDDLMTDIIMKRLRTSDGLDLDWVEKRFGTEIRKTILKGASLGLELDMAEIVTTTTNYREEEEERDTDQEQDGLLSSNASILRLKDPIGFLYSNYIISSIFAELGYE